MAKGKEPTKVETTWEEHLKGKPGYVSYPAGYEVVSEPVAKKKAKKKATEKAE